jgi:gamma-glutamyltranspeptidase / glutathione hydrolase
MVEAGPEAAATVEALAGLGHAAEAADLNSGLHAILIRPDGTLAGAADKRREGLVMGE